MLENFAAPLQARFLDALRDLWAGWGVTGQWAAYLNGALAALLFAAVILAVTWFASVVVVGVVERIVKKTRATWDDCLSEARFFVRASRLAPALTAWALIPRFIPGDGLTEQHLRRAALAVCVLIAARGCAAFCDGVNLIYERGAGETARRKPLKGLCQLVKVFLYIVGAVVAVTTIVNVSPLGILGGLGAMSAVLLLVFKDVILGFVSGLQLAGNDMVRIGDWIEMAKYGADGFVTEITLQTVKVRNWDNTFSTIPIYALVSDSFRNWRGMSESSGRRIKRSIHIDMQSARFLTEEEIARLSRIVLIRDYMARTLAEARAYNEARGIPEGDVSGARLTNLGTFRAYAEAYLQSLPIRAPDMPCIARYLPPDGNGLQMELYMFSADKVWVNYEHAQADIIDHLLAAMGAFSLRVFQNVSGADIRALAPEGRTPEGRTPEAPPARDPLARGEGPVLV